MTALYILEMIPLISSIVLNVGSQDLDHVHEGNVPNVINMTVRICFEKESLIKVFIIDL
jgi:hypothetical protein